MNQVVSGELVEDFTEFFAPASSDLVDGLIGQYRSMRERIEALSAAVKQEQFSGALQHFIDGNLVDQSHGLPRNIEKLFDLDGAIPHLNASYWNKALQMTDVLDLMPQKRRDEWFDQIRNPRGTKKDRSAKDYIIPPIPEFEEESVRATIGGMLLSRSKFFAERVDGIFRSLSREHVTNCPQGFNKRMIIGRAITHYGTVDTSTAGVINDLRCIIARFMGRDEPNWSSTSDIIKLVRQHNGQWTRIDGGALRMRIYNGVGTAHLEVHPDMAWRLNAVLASLYPMAIPESFRTKPARAKKIKDFELFEKPLPFAVINMLAGMKPGYEMVDGAGYRDNKFKNVPMTRMFPFDITNKAALAEAERVLLAIGAVRDKIGNCNIWRFDYEPQSVLDEVVCSGCIPDHKSYQFYPTPDSLAAIAVEMAGIQDGHKCLEPSAGTGAIADLMPADAVCVEISNLHCKVLEAKGRTAIWNDFLPWATGRANDGVRFDRIVMNPPFSEGRWLAHIQHAASLLSDGGRLVAILPSSAKGKDLLPGLICEWSQVYENEFAGTSVSVVILKADRL